MPATLDNGPLFLRAQRWTSGLGAPGKHLFFGHRGRLGRHCLGLAVVAQRADLSTALPAATRSISAARTTAVASPSSTTNSASRIATGIAATKSARGCAKRKTARALGNRSLTCSAHTRLTGGGGAIIVFRVWGLCDSHAQKAQASDGAKE